MHLIQRHLHVGARCSDSDQELLGLDVSRSEAHGTVTLPAREVIDEPQMLAAKAYWDAPLCLEGSPSHPVELLDELLGYKIHAAAEGWISR